MAQTKIRNNTEKFGMIAGIFLPLVTITLFYLFENPGNFILFLKNIFMAGSYLRLFGLCIIPNFVVFFVFRWQKKYKASEGVSIATLGFLLLIVVLKYVN